ncbi:MAG: RNA-directed DNA polymerase [Acidimicrobiales bacterium]|nr:RNA-directed DNA polymerase [Acidimicrobiales bacterium]
MRADPSNTFNSDPGGLRPLRSDIREGVAAARRFAQARDVPDVLGFEDLYCDPGATYELVRGQLEGGVALQRTERFPLPKSDGSATRGLTVLDPYDELGLRSYVGRCSAAIKAATDSRHVLNGLIGTTGPGWFSAAFVEQHRRRRELQRAYYDDDRTAAVGFFDIENFFPSCGHHHAAELLLQAGAPAGAVEVIVQLLAVLFPGGTGLPIGFEGSGPIANLFVGAVDQELVAQGRKFVRWTDDLDVFLTDPALWPELHGMIGELLGGVGLHLNGRKTGMLLKAPVAEQKLLDPSRDSLFAVEGTDGLCDLLEAETMMQSLGLDGQLPAAHLRSVLGRFRIHKDPGALEFLQANPHWFDREPRSVGDYLVAIAADRDAREAIDVTWLMDRAVGRTPDKHTSAGQLHAFRALAEYRVDKQNGQRLHDFAWEQATHRQPSVGAWAVKAWSSSRAWKPNDADHLVDTLSHVGYRRAAVSGYASQPRDVAQRRLKPLANQYREIAPAVTLVTSG